MNKKKKSYVKNVYALKYDIVDIVLHNAIYV